MREEEQRQSKSQAVMSAVMERTPEGQGGLPGGGDAQDLKYKQQ